MASMGDMLKLMQGGTDRTGFADMADQYAYEKPDRSAEERLALLKAAMEAGQGDEEGGEEGGEIGGFDFGGALDNIFGDYVPDSIANMSSEDIEKMEELSQLGLDTRTTFGKGFDKRLTTPKVSSPGVPKTGKVAMPIEEFKPKSFGADVLKYFKKSPLGIALIPTELGAADFPLDDEGMPIYPDEFGMADGGRVGMQQGGAPGGMAMPGLLGVASGSSGNLFSNYMPNPSAVPGPNYGPPLGRPPMQGDPGYNPTPGPGYIQPMPMPVQNFDFGDYLGGPDPYAVTYDPYVDMGGSAYDQYGMGMTQEDIDKVFADMDKFSLAAQEAKRKAAEEAAKKKQRSRGEGVKVTSGKTIRKR
jgi:hypothetical protein